MYVVVATFVSPVHLSMKVWVKVCPLAVEAINNKTIIVVNDNHRIIYF